MIRDSKRTREGNFLKRVHKTVAQGGKVLIPVFAVGRAQVITYNCLTPRIRSQMTESYVSQELCILIETYWERMGLTVPIYFSAGSILSAFNPNPNPIPFPLKSSPNSNSNPKPNLTLPRTLTLTLALTLY